MHQTILEQRSLNLELLLGNQIPLVILVACEESVLPTQMSSKMRKVAKQKQSSVKMRRLQDTWKSLRQAKVTAASGKFNFYF